VTVQKPTTPLKTRRDFLTAAAATAGLATAASFTPTRFAIGNTAKVKIGVLLPYSGTYALLGESITSGLKLYIDQNGGKLGGREVEYVQVDSEMSVPKAAANTSRLVTKENVDFVVGPVHSGIAQVMAKNLGKKKTPIMIVPNAGSTLVTGPLCAPNIFRTSFTNWQPAYPGGKVMAADGRKTCVTIAWKYAAGIQMMDAGKQAFEEEGGKVVKQIYVPFPNVEFQAYFTEIADLKPDCVFAFFGGGGDIKFVKEYAAFGLKKNIPLYGPGFLTEGIVKAQGAAADGIRTTLHYADGMDNPVDAKFRADFKAATGKPSNVFAVQGFDTGALLKIGLDAVGGDAGATANVIAAMEKAKIDSPRGKISFSKAHNVIQDIYLREAQGGENKFQKVVASQLEDPAKGCKM